MNKYTISSIPITLVDYVWKDVEALIGSAVSKSHGEITVETVKQRLKDDSALLVCAIDETTIIGIAVFQVENYDSGRKALVLCLAAGTINIFSGEYDQYMLELANRLGCDEIRAIGCRLGWERKLKSLGCKWEELSTTLIYKV